MEWGVFSVARDIWDHPVLGNEPFTKREAWMWLLSAAAWKQRKVGIGGRVVTVERGEFCFAIRFLERKWNWKPGRVERFLKTLENHDMIRDTNRDNAKVYLISKYNEYQLGHDADRDTNTTENATAPRQDRDKEETIQSVNQQKVLSDKSDPQPLHSEVGTKRAARAAYPESFEQFWKAYPKDPNMSKPKAAGVWAKLNDADKTAALVSVPAFRAYCAKDKTYRPVHAVRYLSERRFDGFAPTTSSDPVRSAELQDKADRMMRRGKYAEQDAAE